MLLTNEAKSAFPAKDFIQREQRVGADHRVRPATFRGISTSRMSLSVASSRAAPIAALGPRTGRRSRANRSRAMRCVAAAASETSEQQKTLKKNADAIADDLKGVTVTFVGDNESANIAVSQEVAKALGYTPLSTPDLIEKITDSTREQILEEDGEAGLVIAENAVLEQLSTLIRCAVGTSGGGRGATARGDCWDYLFGQFTVWIDDAEAMAAAESDPSTAPQREAYELAEVHLVMSKKECKPGDEAAGIGAQALEAIGSIIKDDPQVPGKKGFYVKMGCRGDWPVLQPPGWDGTKEGMVDPKTGKPYRDAEQAVAPKTGEV